MATLLMHLYVGRALKDQGLEIADLPQYYLGCIAPDSVNLEGFAPKEKRWAAHLRNEDLNVWYQNIGAFYREQKDRAAPSLLLGYVIHNLTDVAWDECFHDRVWREMERQNLPPMMDMGLGWDDCFRFDFEELRKPWWSHEVAPALKEALPEPIGVISATLLAAYRDDTLRKYPATIPQGNPILVDEEMVDSLAAVVLKRMKTHLS